MVVAPRLLISDDDRDFRETLGSVFQERGFSTILAADGEEAVHIARRDSVHVILMDFHMPKLTGLEAIRRIKESEIDVPCILISAGINDEIRAQASDAFSLLEKPVDFHRVTETVNAAMRAAYGWRGASKHGRSD